MSEIIHLQIGQCGNQIGQKFWELVAQEHSLNPDGKVKQGGTTGNISTYFCQTKGGIHVPRAILADLQPGPIDSIRASPYGRLFRPENDIFGFSTAGGNFAKGFYRQGSQLIQPILQSTRRESQHCQSLQSLQIVHSMGGGTGSGLTSLILQKLSEQYSGKLISTFSLIPSPNISQSVLEIYNAGLSFGRFQEGSDMTVLVDNQAVMRMMMREEGRKSGGLLGINGLVAEVMSGVSSSQRFPGQLNCSLRKMLTNLNFSAHTHFFTASISPSITSQSLNPRNYQLPQLTRHLLHPKNTLCSVDRLQGRTITASAVFRGNNLSSKQIDSLMLKQQTNQSSYYAQWLPNHIQTSICRSPSNKTSAVMLWNTTAIKHVFERISEKFYSLYKKKAFVHQYVNEGLDEMELASAMEKVNDLVVEYDQFSWTDCGCQDDGCAESEL